MGFVLIGLGFILMLVAFVCYIMVVIKMFQNQQTGLGVGTIIGFFVCGIGYLLALIFGWMNKDKWGLQKIMPIFTGALVVGLILYGAGYALVLPALMDQIEQEQQQMRNQMQQLQQQAPGDMGGDVQFNFDN